MIHRLLLVGIASVFCLACGSSAQQTSSTTASSSSSDASDVVTVTVKLDQGTDALGMFELGANAKGTCEATRGEKDGLNMLVVNCASQAGIVVAQSGQDLLLACSSSHYTEQGCRNYALDLLTHAQRSAAR